MNVAQTLGSVWATRIVFMTGHAISDVMQRALATDSPTYLLKPLNVQDVRSAIELALRSQHTNGDLWCNPIS